MPNIMFNSCNSGNKLRSGNTSRFFTSQAFCMDSLVPLPNIVLEDPLSDGLLLLGRHIPVFGHLVEGDPQIEQTYPKNVKS